jgi:hypothetical protein
LHRHSKKLAKSIGIIGVTLSQALKAARDHLNGPGGKGLRVICTGSSQSKLAMLRSSKSQAFYGARLVAFPTLEKGYVAWLIAMTQAPLSALDPEIAWEAFTSCGCRPEFLVSAVDDLALDFSVTTDNVNERFSGHVANALLLAEQEQLIIPAVQQALLALKAKGLIWHESRGVYLLEDAATAGLLLKNSCRDELSLKTASR